MQEETRQTLIWFASSVPEYKLTEKACFCRLNAVSLDMLSVEKNNKIKAVVTAGLQVYYTNYKDVNNNMPLIFRILNEIHLDRHPT